MTCTHQKIFQNENLKTMSLKILHQIARKLQSAIFSIMADETTDAANHEQVVLVFRWVDKDLSIHEDFVGLRHIPDTRSATIVFVIKSILQSLNLNIHHMRGQCYDGGVQCLGKGVV